MELFIYLLMLKGEVIQKILW